MQGPGLTVLEGYERANRAQREADESALRRGMTGLQLVDRIQQMQRAQARMNAFRQYGSDLSTLESKLTEMGDIEAAERVAKLRAEREYRGALSGAIRPDGTIDRSAIPGLAARRGQFGTLMQYELARERDDEKRAQRGRDQLAIGALAGTPGGSLGGTAPGSIFETSSQGRMLLEQFPDEPEANRAAINAGIQTVAPARAGVFDAYLDHPDPIVRNTAIAGKQSVAMMSDPERAAIHTRTVMDQIGRHLDRVEGRNQRVADREADRSLRRDMFTARTGSADRADNQAAARANRILRESLTIRDPDGKNLGVDTERYPVVSAWAAQIRRADPSLSPEEAAEEALSIPYMSRSQAIEQAKRDVAKMRREVGIGDKIMPGDSFANRYGMTEDEYVTKRAQELVAKAQRDAAQALRRYGITTRGAGQASAASGREPPAAAIQALRANPALAEQFEAHYGRSAADYLHQGPALSSVPSPAPAVQPQPAQQSSVAAPGASSSPALAEGDIERGGQVFSRSGPNQVLNRAATVQRDPRVGILRQQIAEAMKRNDLAKVEVLYKALNEYVLRRYGGWQ